MILAIAGLGGMPAEALADDTSSPEVDARLTTLLSGHADPRDGHVYTVVPAYESLSLLASQLQVPGFDSFRVVASGWSEVVLGDNAAQGGSLANADLDTGYIEGDLAKHRFTLRLGRQLVSGGAARVTQMDGLSATYRMPAGFSLTGYGGIPVTPRFGVSRGDAMVGGRLAWRYGYDTEVGVSAIDVLDQGVAARQDGAVDLRVGIVKQVYLSAYSLLSLTELRLVEANAAVVWQPTRRIQANLEYRRTAPDLFLPRTSIFSVFSQETRDEIGGVFWWRPVDALKIDADYRLILNEEGTGQRATLKALYAADRSGATQLGVEARVLHLPSSGYEELRLFGIRRFGVAFITLDLDGFYLERAINNDQFSFTAAATTGWDFADGWRVVFVGMADVNPLIEHRFEGMVKLVYNHSTVVRTGGTP